MRLRFYCRLTWLARMVVKVLALMLIVGKMEPYSCRPPARSVLETIMRCILAALAVTLLSFSVRAEDTKPNTLTPQQIADGCLLLVDGETTFGWKVQGDVKIADGVLTLGGRKDSCVIATTSFGYCSLQFDALADDAKDSELTFNIYTGPFTVAAPKGTKGWCEYYGQVGPRGVHVWASGTKGFGTRESEAGRTEIGFHVPAGQTLVLRNIKLKPRELGASSVRDLDPIFNGKDLAGWKEFPG